jgi:hypothetical protein
MPGEGPVPKSYPALLAAIIAAAGWYFTKGPGTGKFGDVVNSITHSQTAGGQIGQPANFPQNPPYSAYPSPNAAPIPTNYATYGSQPTTPVSATPPPSPMFGGPAIRIASFNIQVFGDAKAKKPYVMATLASIIQNFQVVAIQEIRTQDD